MDSCDNATSSLRNDRISLLLTNLFLWFAHEASISDVSAKLHLLQLLLVAACSLYDIQCGCQFGTVWGSQCCLLYFRTLQLSFRIGLYNVFSCGVVDSQSNSGLFNCHSRITFDKLNKCFPLLLLHAVVATLWLFKCPWLLVQCVFTFLKLGWLIFRGTFQWCLSCDDVVFWPSPRHLFEMVKRVRVFFRYLYIALKSI